ncbi:ATPase inhibitor [Lecanora helva]
MSSRFLTRALRPAVRTTMQAPRTLSTTTARAAEGDAGAPKSGGAAQSDAFSKREQADENLYVRQKEMEKLASLKQKIDEHKKHLEELDKHVSDQMGEGKK